MSNSIHHEIPSNFRRTSEDIATLTLVENLMKAYHLTQPDMPAPVPDEDMPAQPNFDEIVDYHASRETKRVPSTFDRDMPQPE